MSREIESVQRGELPLLFGASLLVLACSTVVVATLAFAVGASLPVWTLPMAFVLTTGFAAYGAGMIKPGRVRSVTIGIMAGCLAVLAAGAWTGNEVLDCTFDGRWFHREAVNRLETGWNPLTTELSADEVVDRGARDRINAYPKAPWILAASVSILTGETETGSAFAFVLMAAAGLLAFAALSGLGRLGGSGAAVLALAFALNPIAVGQLTTSLVDGSMVSVLLALTAAAVGWFRKRSRISLIAVSVAIVLGVNMKQSALPFVMLLVAGLGGLWILIERRFPSRRVVGAVGSGLIVGVAVIGAHPHITNVLRYGNWAYPYKASTVTATSAMPVKPLGRVHAFVKSAFSRPRHSDSLPESRVQLATGTDLKGLFDVSAETMAPFRFHGVRIGGWGPLFGAMVLTGGLCLILVTFVDPRWGGVTAMLLLVIAVNALAFPFPWVFRLVPQSWWLPLIPAAAVVAHPRIRAARCLGWTVAVLGLVNVGLVTWSYTTATVRQTSFLERRFEALAADNPVSVHFRREQAERERLIEHGVQVRTVDDMRYWLGVYIGWQKPSVTVGEPRIADDGPVLDLRWTGVEGVVDYRVRVIESPPAGPKGRRLLLRSQKVRATDVVLPVPGKPFMVTVEACNFLGCGPGRTFRAVPGAPQDRPRPVIGMPLAGEAYPPTLPVTWLGPSTASRYRVVVKDRVTGNTVVDTVTDERSLSVTLEPGGTWTASVAVDEPKVGLWSRPVDFRTHAPGSGGGRRER